MFLKKIALTCVVGLTFQVFNHLDAAIAGGNPSGVAAPTDAYAGVVNPAGIMYVGDRYDAGFRWLQDRKHTKFVGNSNPAANQDLNASYRQQNEFFADVAINKTFKKKNCCRTWEWALNFVSYTEIFSRASYKVPVLLAGTTPLDFTAFRRVVSLIGGVKLNDEHAIGLSLDFSKFRFRVKGAQNFDNPLSTVSVGHVTNKGYANTYAFGVTLGWRWQVTKALALGAVYTPQIHYERIHKYRGFHPEHGLLESPALYKIGLLYAFTPKLAGVFDIEWTNYSRAQNPGNRLLNSLGDFNVLGARNGASAGWRDRFVITSALAYSVSDELALRAYYIHYTQKVPRNQTYYNTVLVSIFTDILACGGTYKFWKTNEISVFYAHAFEKNLKGRNSIPRNVGGGEANLREGLDILSVSIGHNY